MPLGPRPEPLPKIRTRELGHVAQESPKLPDKPPQYQNHAHRSSIGGGRVPVGPRPLQPESPNVYHNTPIQSPYTERGSPLVVELPQLRMPEPPVHQPEYNPSRLPYPVDDDPRPLILPPLKNVYQSSDSVARNMFRAESFAKCNFHNSTRSSMNWIPNELLPPVPDPHNPALSAKLEGMSIKDGELTIPLDLPELPPMSSRQASFSSEQLTVADFEQCTELWSLSGLAHWLLWLVSAYDLTALTIELATQAFAKLFLYRIQDLEWALAEALSSQVLRSFTAQSFMVVTEENSIVLTRAPICGVIPQLTGGGCYSQSLHNQSSTKFRTRCYSHQCLKEPRLRKISIAALRRAGRASDVNAIDRLLEPESLEMDWAAYWGVEPDAEGDAIKRQYAIHEFIMSEESYVRDLELYVEVYGDSLAQSIPPVMEDQASFHNRVFGRISDILKVNRPFVACLRTRQQQQGPYIHSIGDLVLKWANNLKTIEAYAAYADDYLWSDNHLRQELAQSPRLEDWMSAKGKLPALMGKPHSFFFHRVLPRLARYDMLLSAIVKRTPQSSIDELRQVKESITAVKLITRECDTRVDRQQRLLDVHNLRAHIVFKTPEVTADLKLSDSKRRVIKRGDLLRKGKVEWIRTHMLLLDNFLVLSKLREGQNGTAFYITKSPIPLDLLIVEQADEEAQYKRMSKKTGSMISGVSGSNASGNWSAPESPATPDQEPEYVWPLRISHLGVKGQSYVLYTTTREDRDEWAAAIIEAQQMRAVASFTRAAEPFRLKLLADCFAYPETESPKLPLAVPATTLSRVAPPTEELSQVLVRRRVHSVTPVSSSLLLVGTDIGLFLGHATATEWQWTKALDLSKVSGVEVIDTFNAVIVATDKSLVWYPLDQVVARGLGDHRAVAGRRLTRQRKVIDFEVTFHSGRVLLMALLTDSSSIAGLHLNNSKLLKVLEPVRSRGVQAMRKLPDLPPAAACIDYFREIDRVSLQGDITRITPFLHSLVVNHGSHGFEYLTLDAKLPRRIPTKMPRDWQHHGKPLSAIKLDDSRLLLCYESCCALCGTDGQAIDTAPVTWFLGHAVAVAYEEPYLVIVSAEMIEIRYAQEFPARLVQIITGKDVVLMGAASGRVMTGTPTRLRIAHPTVVGRQLLVELVFNDGTTRDALGMSQSSLGALRNG